MEPQEQQVLLGRWAELQPVLRIPWAARELTCCNEGSSLAEATGKAGTGRWDDARTSARRTSLGQVFTPPAFARRLARMVLPAQGKVLDPACGDGSLLVAVADEAVAMGAEPVEVLQSLEGWDLDPWAVWLARARLVEWAVQHGVEGRPSIHTRNALDDRNDERFAAVVANPPYLEAKRMRKAQPGLREALAERFPRLKGAWDLYMAFLEAAETWVAPGGRAAFLLPNKVLQARYAADLRTRWTGVGAGLRIAEVVDCSVFSPRPFPSASVYPVLIGLSRAREMVAYRAERATCTRELEAASSQAVSMQAIRDVHGERPIFVPFSTWPWLEGLFGYPRFDQVARVASTCSFHKKGLRERFVGRSPDVPFAMRYLGGVSRSRRTEVRCFELGWQEHWISYDEELLAKHWKNPLPPRGIFTRPKAILCQHARRVQAVADKHGRYATKDVYPVCWSIDSRWTLDELVVLLNSTVFTALYNTLYQGVRVGGETYHYLPVFLHSIPVPRREHPALDELTSLAARLGEGADSDSWDKADRLLAASMGVGPKALEYLRDEHLRRVGADCPG